MTKKPDDEVYSVTPYGLLGTVIDDEAAKTHRHAGALHAAPRAAGVLHLFEFHSGSEGGGMTDTPEIERIRAALAAGPTPGQWFVQYGDDQQHMCCTAVSSANKRAINEGQWRASECEALVALTHHQCYPFVEPDCERDDENSEYIAACNPAAMTAVLAHIDAQAAEVAKLKAVVSNQGDALQRAGSAAGLLAGSNLHTELAPEIEKLRKGAERYQWLRQNSRELVDIYINEEYKNMTVLDAATNAAMKETP